MTVILAHNPYAGGHDPVRLDALRLAFEAAGYPTAAIDSNAIDRCGLLSEAALLCVAGGDGTLRDVIGKLDGKASPAVAMFPMGTVNLVAREAGYPTDPARFVARALGRQAVRRHHPAKVNGKTFLVCASVGPESAAVASVSCRLKRRVGRLAYIAALAALLRSWPRRRLTVTVADRRFTAEAAFVLKGRYFAGPWSLAPADMCKPHFEVLLLPRARRRDYLRLAAYAMLGRFADPDWQRIACESLRIEADDAAPVQADGDIVTRLPAEFRVDSRPLDFA